MRSTDPPTDGSSRWEARAHEPVPVAYRRALVWITAGWVVALGIVVASLSMGLHTGFAPDLTFSVFDTIVIATGSLLVAFLSTIPSMRSGASGSFFRAMLAGISIRLLGTVALFLTCRYQLASSAEIIAGMTIGWYVLLTSVEVVAVSRFLPDAMQRNASPAITDVGITDGTVRPTSELPSAT